MSPSVPGHLSFLVLCSSEDCFFFFFEPLCSSEHYFVSQTNPRTPCFAEAAETGPPVTGGASLGVRLRRLAPFSRPMSSSVGLPKGHRSACPSATALTGCGRLSVPRGALPRARPPEGAGGELASPSAPVPPSLCVPLSTSCPHPRRFLSSPVGGAASIQPPGHFLTPLGLGPLRFLQIRVLIWAAETIRGSQPRSAPAARGVCEGPSEPPRRGAGVYTETFQGRLGLGSQTVLLGSLGLPRGHTFKRSESSVS